MDTKRNTFTESTAGGIGNTDVLAAPPQQIFYFQSDVNLDPVAAVVGASFVLSGTTSCDQLKDILSDQGNETEIFVRHADDKLTNVLVTVGGAPSVAATPTGPGDTPWTSWTATVSGLPDGPVTVSVEAFPSRNPATAGRSTVVDLTPPALTIDQPADVVRPAPPFIATITGTAADNASGVAAVEWQFGDGAVTAAAGTTGWSADVPLPGLGLHTVSFRARDNIGNVGPMQNVTVRVGDITPPALAIAVPEDGETRPLVEGQATFELRGTASDTQSGVALVEWSLDGTTFTAATAQVADWSIWSAPVPITVAGNHTITVRATDQATPGNATTLQRGVVVAERFQPPDPDAVFSPAAYLDDLLGFATHRAKVSAAGPFITRQLLVDTYLQPFADLVTPDNRVVANQPASQVRLCIDVLRRYLAAHGASVPADAEAAYRQAAYAAVLRQLGTSSEDMRLARVADEPTRTALANRLGIALARFRPDRLDQLLFQPADLTEAALKTFFGFEETTIKPLVDSLLPEPALLTWQKEHLRADWQAQDDAGRTEWDTPVPLIDPDVLSVQDLRTPNPGNPAYDLWKARQDDVAAHAASLDQLRTGPAHPAGGVRQDRLDDRPDPGVAGVGRAAASGRCHRRPAARPAPAAAGLLAPDACPRARRRRQRARLGVGRRLRRHRPVPKGRAVRRLAPPGAAEGSDPRSRRVPAVRSHRFAGARAGRLAGHIPGPPGLAPDARGARAAGADTHPGDPGGGERRRGGRVAGAPGGVPGRDHR